MILMFMDHCQSNSNEFFPLLKSRESNDFTWEKSINCVSHNEWFSFWNAISNLYTYIYTVYCIQRFFLPFLNRNSIECEEFLGESQSVFFLHIIFIWRQTGLRNQVFVCHCRQNENTLIQQCVSWYIANIKGLHVIGLSLNFMYIYIRILCTFLLCMEKYMESFWILLMDPKNLKCLHNTWGVPHFASHKINSLQHTYKLSEFSFEF